MSFKGALSQLLRLPTGLRFEKALQQPEQAQWRKLQQILKNNANTAFGREHGFANIHSVADYQQAVPIRPHEGFLPWLEPMLQGEANQLTYQDPIYYCVTSGTAGAPKPSPITPDYRDEYQRVVHAFLYYTYKEHPQAFDGKVLYFNGSAEKGKTPAGVDTGTMSGFNSKNLPPLLKRFYAVPYEGMLIADPESRYFCVALLALAQPVSMMIAITAAPLLRFAQTLQAQAGPLLDHLEKGTLPDSLVLTASERELVLGLHKAAPARARELRQLLERESWLNPQKVWQKLELLVCWKSSTAGSLLPELEKAFPGLTVRDAVYSATEGWCNVPYTDKLIGGPLAVHAHFYEFIEAEKAGPVLLAHQLEVGKQYRILYTTSGGMYRYDIGDILQVTHYYRNTPSVYFARKQGQFGNLMGERLDAEQGVNAITAVSNARQISAPFYFLLPDSSAFPPHYRLYLDLQHDQAAFADEVDAYLQAHNSEYKAKRSDGQLGPLVPWQLPADSLTLWRERRLAAGADEAQLKPPGLISDPQAMLGLEAQPLN